MSLTNQRSKIASICLLIVCLGFSAHTTSAYAGRAWSSPSLTVRVDPAVKNVEPGQTFAIHVMVDGAVDVGAFQFDIIYNPAVVSATGVELGPFLGSTGRTAQSIGATVDNVAGAVTFGAFSFGDSAGAEGAGLLAAVTFAAVGPGTCALNLQNVVVTDVMANVQTASVKGGVVTVAAPASVATPTMAPSPTLRPTPTGMPAPTDVATATETAEPVPAATPTGTAAATATSGPVSTPTPPPVDTETAMPVVPTVPMPTPGPLASVPAETPEATATVTRVPSPTPGVSVSPSASPVPSPSPTGRSSRSPCRSAVGVVGLVAAGWLFCVLLRRHSG